MKRFFLFLGDFLAFLENQDCYARNEFSNDEIELSSKKTDLAARRQVSVFGELVVGIDEKL